MTPSDLSFPAADEQLWSLTAAMCDGTITEEERDSLEAILRSSEDARLFYAAYMDLHGRMLWRYRGARADESAAESQSSLADVPVVYAAEPGAAIPSPTIHGAASYFSSGWPVAYLVATVIFAIGLLAGSILHVSQPTEATLPSTASGRGAGGEGASLPSPGTDRRLVGRGAGGEGNVSSIVGRITGMVDCVWEGTGNRDQGSGESENNLPSSGHRPEGLVAGRAAGGKGGLSLHSPIHLNDRLALRSGLLEITYDAGAKVILQGPVTYEVDSAAGGFLSVGKLTARLEKKAEEAGYSRSAFPLPPSAFAITTPTAVVTDLGTEFGVEVNESGWTVTRVFRGIVEVQPATEGDRPRGVPIQLRANQSVQVVVGKDGKRPVVLRISDQPQGFVRRLVPSSKLVDLLDIVAGGNGAGHRRERGIDPSSGMEDANFLGSLHTTDHKYHPSPYFELIDGVFVPEGSRGPVQLDSAGHKFNLPGTLGQSAGSIWARAYDVWPESLKTDINYWAHCGKFGDDFMPQRRGLLAMHSNVGLTFSLDAIRRAREGRQFNRFRATAGKDKSTLADLWVFIDGRLAWSALHLTDASGVKQINVPIRPEDRFLTLVSTDGGEQVIGGDWTVFGDPVLEWVASEGEQTDGKP